MTKKIATQEVPQPVVSLVPKAPLETIKGSEEGSVYSVIAHGSGLKGAVRLWPAGHDNGRVAFGFRFRIVPESPQVIPANIQEVASSLFPNIMKWTGGGSKHVSVSGFVFVTVPLNGTHLMPEIAASNDFGGRVFDILSTDFAAFTFLLDRTEFSEWFLDQIRIYTPPKAPEKTAIMLSFGGHKAQFSQDDENHDAGSVGLGKPQTPPLH